MRLTVSQSVCFGVEPRLGLMTRYLLLFDSYGFVFMASPLWREDGSVYCICCWSSLAQSFLGSSSLGLATIFYCLRFETSLFVASYDSHGHGGGIRRISAATGPHSIISAWTTQKTQVTLLLPSEFIGSLTAAWQQAIHSSTESQFPLLHTGASLPSCCIESLWANRLKYVSGPFLSQFSVRCPTKVEWDSPLSVDFYAQKNYSLTSLFELKSEVGS
jgi:hypothetical protein